MRLPLLRAGAAQGLCFFVGRFSSNEFIRGRLNRKRQILENPFEQNPFAVVGLVTESGADPLQDELRCSVERYREAVSLEKASGDDAMTEVRLGFP